MHETNAPPAASAPFSFVALLLFFLVSSLAVYGVRAQRAPDYSRYRIGSLFERNYWPSVETPNIFTDVTRQQSEWFTCPNGTYYAVDSANKAASVDIGQAANLHHRVLGCIPEGHRACAPLGANRLIGSCPVDSYCVYQRFRDGDALPRFQGCVEDIARACYGKICPDGYTCCPAARLADSFCVPNDGNSTDYENLCGLKTRTLPTYADDTLHNRLPRRESFVPRGPLFENGVYYVQAQGYNMTADLTLVPPRYRDDRGSHCHLDDLMDIFDYPFLFNSTTNNTDSVPFGVNCCPVDTEHCYGLRQQTDPNNHHEGVLDFIGCANPVRQEQCCGYSICAQGQKCCNFFPAYFNTTEPDSVAVFGRQICCPEGTQCCFGNPAIIAAVGAYPPPDTVFTDRFARAFCGLSIDGVDCAMDALAPASSYLLTARRGSTGLA